MTKKVFVSHSSEDKAFVRRLVSDLESRGIPVWYDEFDLRVGDSLGQRIGQGIEESGWLLVVLSEHSVQSPWVQKELNAAFALEMSRRDVFILPAVIDGCRIPLFLGDRVYADFRSSYENGLSALLARFGRDTATLGRLIYSSEESDNLYDGWTLYCTSGVSSRSIMQLLTDDGKRIFDLRAYDQETVGVNLSVRSLYGSAVFYYRILRGDAWRQNVLFTMIPMQENSLGRTGLIEVGSDFQDAPRNAVSPYRRRYPVPPEHYVSNSWHRGSLEYDFRDTPTAFYSIFAPRINEGCVNPGGAELLVGEVMIYTRE